MEASLAATGIFEVLATKQVLCIIDSSFPFLIVFNSGKSDNTSAISFPLSPQPTYTTTSVFEYLDKAYEIQVLPHPKAPGIAQVPPNTDGKRESKTL